MRKQNMVQEGSDWTHKHKQGQDGAVRDIQDRILHWILPSQSVINALLFIK